MVTDAAMIWTEAAMPAAESNQAGHVCVCRLSHPIATINNLIRTIMSQKKNATEEHWQRASEHMVLS